MRNERQRVRINDIFYVIIKDKKMIAVLVALGLMAGIILSTLGYIRGEMSKQYKITASVAITDVVDDGVFASRQNTPNRDDFSLSKEMTESAIYVISSDSAMSAVIEKLDVIGVSAKSIKNNLTVTQHNDTQIIELALTWRSEKEGIKILQTLTEVSDDMLLNTLHIGKLSLINSPSATYIFGGSIKITTLIYATVLGLLIGIIISVIKLLAAPKLLRAEDMESLFGIELLGTVPYHENYSGANPLEMLPDTVDTELKSSASILLNRMERAGKKSLYVTSAMHKEGKTRLVADLAVKISETGKRVLLVDCHFKNPTLSSAFGVNNFVYSLNKLYDGECDKTDAIMQLSGCLYLLPSVLDRRAELMGDTMMRLLEEIFKDYDIVLIDADAIGENPEVIKLNKVADTALFIAEFDSTELSVIRKALLQISKSGLPTAGCIVNATRTWREVLRNIDTLAQKANKIQKSLKRKTKNSKSKKTES